MPDYRRFFVPGGTFFFTLVIEQRRPILTTDLGREVLRRALEEQCAKRPFSIIAMVLLPEHLHTLWVLPPGDSRYPLRWRQIKESFTRGFLAGGGTEAHRSTSRALHRERAVWQRRYWEHTCFDEDDLKHHLDYIHWNPVKHGLVRRVADWPWSSFHRYVSMGEYEMDWGGEDPHPQFETPEL